MMAIFPSSAMEAALTTFTSLISSPLACGFPRDMPAHLGLP
jgi:hypothetical protein